MTYQPIDIVERMRCEAEARYAEHNDAAGAGEYVGRRMCAAAVDGWRTALAAELERLADNVAPAVPEGFVDVRIAYRHAARLVRGDDAHDR